MHGMEGRNQILGLLSVREKVSTATPRSAQSQHLRRSPRPEGPRGPHRILAKLIRSACDHSSSPVSHDMLSEAWHQTAAGPPWPYRPRMAHESFRAAGPGAGLGASLHPLDGVLIDPKDQQIVAAFQLAFQLDGNGSQMQESVRHRAAIPGGQQYNG